MKHGSIFSTFLVKKKQILLLKIDTCSKVGSNTLGVCIYLHRIVDLSISTTFSGEARANMKGVHLFCGCIDMICGWCLYGENLIDITEFLNFGGCMCTH
jgi:hypothetical protein